MTPKKYCNICGIPTSEFDGDVCRACPNGAHCHMDESMLIEQKVYDYAKNHNLLSRLGVPSFDPAEIRRRCYKTAIGNTLPKYFREAIECDGQTFATVFDIPHDESFRVCRENPAAIIRLRVGRVVKRQENMLRILPDNIMLSPADANIALKGVHFESSYL